MERGSQFEANLHRKAGMPEFRGDTLPLLRPGVGWDFDEAFAAVMNQVIARLPGDGWKGGEG